MTWRGTTHIENVQPQGFVNPDIQSCTSVAFSVASTADMAGSMRSHSCLSRRVLGVRPKRRSRAAVQSPAAAAAAPCNNGESVRKSGHEVQTRPLMLSAPRYRGTAETSRRDEGLEF